MRAAVTRVLAVLAALLVVLQPAGAHAHTGLESSTPADGETVEGPLRSIVLEFTGTPTAIDGGIVVAGDDGASYEPTAVMQDGTTITAFFEPPLGAGAYATTWIVRSDDTHTVTDSFAFTVTAPATTTTVAPTTSVEPAPSTEQPQPETTEAPALQPPVTEAAVDDETTAAAPAQPPPAEPPAAEGVVAPAVPSAVQAIEDGESTARIGRLILFPAAVVAVGILAFAASSYAGRRDELGALLRLVRWLGVAVVIGAVVELVGLEPVYGGWGELAAEAGGRAAIARALAGVCLAIGVGSVLGPRTAAPGSLSAAVLEGDEAPPVDDAATRWRPASHPIALVGVALLVVSFAFDGHTLSEGPRLVHALASVTHVVAASVWAGGLVALAVVLWRRHRAGVRSRAAQMVTRFSVVAMVSVGLAGLAGVLMAWFIEDDLGAYTSTDWGRTMLAKLALVLVALGIGAYNHFRLRPALDEFPDDAGLVARTRTTVTVEAAVLVVVALVTAVLVGASTL